MMSSVEYHTFTRRRLSLIYVALLMACCLFGTNITLRAELSDAQLKQIAFEQFPGRQVPLDTVFQDSQGRSVRLGDCLAKGKPAILVPGYFRCKMLCEGVTDGLIRALQGNREVAGPDFRVIYISIDPKETKASAQERKKIWLQRYGRSRSEVRFLSGNSEAIRNVTEAIGYNFVYDPESHEYAHPAGFVVLRPDGTVFRYFFGVAFSAEDLQDALTTAALPSRPPASRIEQLVLLCFHYNPLRSRYGALVMNTVRVLSLGTMAGLVFLVLRKPKGKGSSS